MFTGIVEELGRVLAIEHRDASAGLRLGAERVLDDVRLGQSIAVNGICLTVTAFGDDWFDVDVMPETLRRTSLAKAAPGRLVNLERALPAGGRLDGHIVQGHVDGVGTLVSRNSGPDWEDLTFELPAALAKYVAEKGSIAIDGVSLTVTGVDEAGIDTFGVSLIPTTLAHTTLGDLAVGDIVNLEVDVIAKYVRRLLSAEANGAASLRGAGSTANETPASVAVASVVAAPEGGAR